MTAKSLVRNVTERLGYDVVKKRPSFVDFMRRHSLDTVLDVGANEGQHVGTLRDRGYPGRVVSFEPTPGAFAVLSAAAARDHRWTAVNAGLGDRDEEQEIGVSAASVFSSFKPPSDYIKRFDPDAKAEHTARVKVMRLDTYHHFEPFEPLHTYLKVDTQGFEKEVVDGAGELLAQFPAVQLELPVKHLYDGQDGWLEMIRYMADREFRVAMIKESNFDRDTFEVIEFDVLFSNARLINA
jgi:FkbM family methyltransferase